MEHFSEDLWEIMKKEKGDPIISDSENKNLIGRLQNFEKDYFLFINTGNGFNIIRLDKWYRFSNNIESKAAKIEEKPVEEEENAGVVEEEEKDYDGLNVFREEELRKQQILERKLKRKMESKILDPEKIKEIMKNKKITVKELVKEIKEKFKVTSKEKLMIQKFVKEECRVVKENDENMLELKK